MLTFLPNLDRWFGGQYDRPALDDHRLDLLLLPTVPGSYTGADELGYCRLGRRHYIRDLVLCALRPNTLCGPGGIREEVGVGGCVASQAAFSIPHDHYDHHQALFSIPRYCSG